MPVLLEKDKIKKRKIVATCFFIIVAIFLLVNTVLTAPALAAQDPNVLFYGGLQEQTKNAIGLGEAKDPRIIAASIIRIFLGFLGLIAVGLIIYAGWLWMTSAGDEQKIEKAKNTIKNAIIGLVIIMASFGIVTFILNRLLGSVGGGSGPGPGPGPGPGGLGAIGSCTVESVYPEPNQKEVPRNTALIVTFKEAVDQTTVCNDLSGNGICDSGEKIIPANVRVFKTSDGDGASNITGVEVFPTADNKTFVFVFDSYLGSPSEYIWYSVHLTKEIEKVDKSGIDDSIFFTCNPDYLEWQFEVSNKIDLTPPQVLNVFPPPDDQKDTTTPIGAAQAEGKITVDGQPKSYVAAKVNSVTKPLGAPWSDANATVDNSCNASGSLDVGVDVGLNVTLSKGGTLLGGGAVSGSTATFSYCDMIFTLTGGSFGAGNAWIVDVSPEQKADTLTAGGTIYTFVSGAPGANEIQLGATANLTAANIASKLNSRSDLSATQAGNVVDLTAEEFGKAGNNIELSTNNSTNIIIIPMTGGADSQTIVTIKDKKDQPRNSVIKINFNEAINPITVSGKSTDVASYIRVVDISIGNILTGNFIVSNQYRTVEFISDDLCGVNACGEKIYCLPENSNLKVELMAASLFDCQNNNTNCANKSPYITCMGNVCQDANNLKYPLSAMPFDGIMDAALNSLDGNRDGDADGPVSFYDQNSPDPLTGDNYKWSFFISDIIDLTTPEIDKASPPHLDAGVSFIDPVIIDFTKIMMSSSLRTGQTSIYNGQEYVTHKLINIRSLSNISVGYWIAQTDIDSPPPDGEPDYTQAEIRHSMFSDSTSFRSQVGSGVKDIYQNCFKPSSSQACTGTPSCCGETPTSNSECP